MSKFDIHFNEYDVAAFTDAENAPSVISSNNALMIVAQPGQSISVDANDDVPVFLGCKDFLTGKAYSINEAIRERPYIDLKSLINNLHLNPNKLMVYLGPSLTFSHTEQPDEVLARVKELGYDLACKGTSGKHYLDQQVLILLQLRKLGIPMENIHTSSYDTFDEASLKSEMRGDEKKNRFVATLH